MIQIFKPNIKNLAKGTAVHLAFQYGMTRNAPLKISEVVGENGNPIFNELKELEGISFLTSLELVLREKRFTLRECLISVNMEKNIVTTPLQGRDGTIKEYISDGDYNISVEAGISRSEMDSAHNSEIEVDNDMEYPLEELRTFQEFLNSKENIGVQSDFLNLFGVTSVVIKSYSFEQETHSNRQSVSIQMLSDLPYEIQLKENNDVKVK